MIRITKATPLVLLVVAAFTILLVVSWTSSTKEKYTIISKNGTYHTETFRMYGKGVVFQADGKNVLLMGDLDILSNITK